MIRKHLFEDTKFLWLVIICSLVGVLEIFSLMGMRLENNYSIPLFLLIIVGIGYNTLWHGLTALFELNFRSINTLMLVAVLGAFYLGQYEEAAIVICLYTLAEKLEDIGIETSQSAFKNLIQKMPKMVLLKGQLQPQAVDTVKIDEVMLIHPFEIIPLDGIVTNGFSNVDESPITGEFIPKDKSEGDSVFAGSTNKQGYLEVKVTKDNKNSTINRIKELTLQANKMKAKAQKFIETFSQYYTPSIILLAFLWVLVPVLFLHQPFDLWLLKALTLIVIACPCALVISTPISIYSAIGNAATQGVLIKSGQDLESIGQIKAIALDKTRTLTYGKPVVSKLIPYGNETEENLLQCAAGIEIFSEHPLAQSIVETARKNQLTIYPGKNYQSFVGKGAKADCLICNDSHHCIGKLSFILEEHVVPEDIVKVIDAVHQEGQTSILIATHKNIKGVIALQDQLRPESRSFIDDLKKLNIKTVMLTGDHPSPSEAVAKELGIDEVKSELLPEDKAKAIAELMKKYRAVAMVGDGVNDAPALALSTVGISMSKLGNDVALEAASIILLRDQLDAIPNLIRLGKRTLWTIRFNTALALGIKLLFVFLAFMGISHLALAIFADVGVTLIVILISLRLMK